MIRTGPCQSYGCILINLAIAVSLRPLACFLRGSTLAATCSSRQRWLSGWSYSVTVRRFLWQYGITYTVWTIGKRAGRTADVPVSEKSRCPGALGLILLGTIPIEDQRASCGGKPLSNGMMRSDRPAPRGRREHERPYLRLSARFISASPASRVREFLFRACSNSSVRGFPFPRSSEITTRTLPQRTFEPASNMPLTWCLSKISIWLPRHEVPVGSGCLRRYGSFSWRSGTRCRYGELNSGSRKRMTSNCFGSPTIKVASSSRVTAISAGSSSSVTPGLEIIYLRILPVDAECCSCRARADPDIVRRTGIARVFRGHRARSASHPATLTRPETLNDLWTEAESAGMASQWRPWDDSHCSAVTVGCSFFPAFAP